MKEDTIIPFEKSSPSQMPSPEPVTPRHKAGFEASAGPDDPFFIFPQKFWLFGLSTYVMIFTIIIFAIGFHPWVGLIFFIMPIFCGLLIFMPDIFAHPLHYRFQFGVWALMTIMLIGWFIYALAWQKPKDKKACDNGADKTECDYRFGTMWPTFYAWTWLCEPAVIVCAVISYRLYASTGAD